jgi:hypothetical protein
VVGVFVIGFPKSGTRTLHLAFRAAKLRSAHWVAREGFCGQVMYRAFREGRNPMEDLRRYHCIAQADVCLPGQSRHGEELNFWPQLDFEMLDAIERANPEIKFILNRRDPAALIGSIDRWGGLRKRIVDSDIVGLPPGKGHTDAELLDWIEGHYRRCAERFDGKPNFLDFEIGDPDAQTKVGDFIGVDLPWWGVANSNPQRAASETEPEPGSTHPSGRP